MSNPTATGWTETSNENADRRRTVGFLLKGVSVGLLAGMGAFVYNMAQFVPLDVGARLLLVPMACAGAFAHLLAPTLRRSIRLGLTGFFVGLLVLFAAWIAPLGLVAELAAPRQDLLPEMAGDAFTAAFLNYSPTYLGGYLLTVSVAAFWE